MINSKTSKNARSQGKDKQNALRDRGNGTSGTATEWGKTGDDYELSLARRVLTSMPQFTAKADAGAAKIDAAALKPQPAEEGSAAAQAVSADDTPEISDPPNVVDNAACAPAPLVNADYAVPGAHVANTEVISASASNLAATGDSIGPASNDALNVAVYSNPEADRVLPNRDEHDVRMAEIAEIFDHVATPLLERCALVAEWVHHAELKLQSRGQLDQKPLGGRPEGGILWAARELRLPGKTVEARRQLIRRAITINTLSPEIKVAVREAKLDKNQSALLFIAKGNSAQEQFGKLQEFLARKAAGRHSRKGLPEDDVGQSTLAISDSFALGGPTHEVLSDAERADVAAMQRTWEAHQVLPRIDWERAAPKVRRRFAAILMAAPQPADDESLSSAPATQS
jgi:hypothetical protein